MAKPQLTLATGNRHKLAEMAELLPGVELRPLPDGFEMPPEDGDSFAANAEKKARETALAAQHWPLPEQKKAHNGKHEDREEKPLSVAS